MTEGTNVDAFEFIADELGGIKDEAERGLKAAGGVGIGAKGPVGGGMPSEDGRRVRSFTAEARMRESNSRLINSWPRLQ